MVIRLNSISRNMLTVMIITVRENTTRRRQVSISYLLGFATAANRFWNNYNILVQRRRGSFDNVLRNEFRKIGKRISPRSARVSQNGPSPLCSIIYFFRANVPSTNRLSSVRVFWPGFFFFFFIFFSACPNTGATRVWFVYGTRFYRFQRKKKKKVFGRNFKRVRQNSCRNIFSKTYFIRSAHSYTSGTNREFSTIAIRARKQTDA